MSGPEKKDGGEGVVSQGEATKSCTAEMLLNAHGHELLGKVIETAAIGDWPGGAAEIIQLCPDPGGPEIVFNVRHLKATDPDDSSKLWEIGVFDWEIVRLLQIPPEKICKSA